MAKERIKYYDDESVDMVDYGIKQKELPKDFEYINSNVFYNFISFILYHIIAKPIVTIFVKLKFGAKIKNKEVLKPYKNQGVFFYCNHTHVPLDQMQPSRFRRRKNYIVASNDATSIFGLKNIVLMLGAMPVPTNYSMQKKFLHAINVRIGEKKGITIYPEATIWPYYTGVRPFSSASFAYPIHLNAPSFAVTTTYQKRRIRKKPKITTYIDGPFLPDTSLPLKEAKEKLHKEIYDTLVKRSNEYSTYAYYEYRKRPQDQSPNT